MSILLTGCSGISEVLFQCDVFLWQCLNRTQLCDGNRDCVTTGNDESPALCPAGTGLTGALTAEISTAASGIVTTESSKCYELYYIRTYVSYIDAMSIFLLRYESYHYTQQ